MKEVVHEDDKLDIMIFKYNMMAESYRNTAKSKKLFNEDAAEHDQEQSEEYQQIAEWLQELRDRRNANERL